MNQAVTDTAVSVIDYTIGENVDILRRRAGLSIGEIGMRFGVTPSAMSLKLRGKRAWSAQDLHHASRLFSVRMAQLTGEEKMPEPTAPATVSDITDLLARRREVDPAGLEPTTSTVESPRSADTDYLAPIIPIFNRTTNPDTTREAI